MVAHNRPNCAILRSPLTVGAETDLVGKSLDSPTPYDEKVMKNSYHQINVIQFCLASQGLAGRLDVPRYRENHAPVFSVSLIDVSSIASW